MNTCIDHGNYCYQCEQDEVRREEVERIQDVVSHWSWNYNIFEIYDEIKDLDEWEVQALLSYAYKYFNTQDSKDLIRELADHLCVSCDKFCEDCLNEGCGSCDAK